MSISWWSSRRFKFTDDQRRTLAAEFKKANPDAVQELIDRTEPIVTELMEINEHAHSPPADLKVAFDNTNEQADTLLKTIQAKKRYVLYEDAIGADLLDEAERVLKKLLERSNKCVKIKPNRNGLKLELKVLVAEQYFIVFDEKMPKRSSKSPINVFIDAVYKIMTE